MAEPSLPNNGPGDDVPVEPQAKRQALRTFSRGALLSLAFLIVACASQDSTNPSNFDRSRADRFFVAGYRDVAESYIDEVMVNQLAIAGLESLAAIDPNISVAVEREEVRIALEGEETIRFHQPNPNDVTAWASLTTAAISLARSKSKELEEANAERLYETVFDGMLGELDQFSRYSGREEARNNRASRDGFGGIGIRINISDEGIRVLSVMEKTPAEAAGLKAEDLIVKIDGVDTTTLSQKDAIHRLRGRLRSKVKLDVEREGHGRLLPITVTRAKIVQQTVRIKKVDEIAHITVSGFNQNTTQNLRLKVREVAQRLGPKLKGYVIDLRGNPGGLLDQAVGVSDLFITGGRIVSTHGRHPDSEQFFDAEPDDVADGLPIVVLINSNSASASEIVAAALQDSGRAVIIGSNSYGKGTVQNVFRLPNQGELALTWARFHAPSGYALHQRGVLPDICTTKGIDSAEDVLAELRQGTMPIDHNIRNISPDFDDPAAIKLLRDNCPPRQTTASIDLEVAERLLTEPSLYVRALGEVSTGTTAQLSNVLDRTQSSQ
ncbi:S41 family peptidase [Pelagibius sp. Alg239-R121]|uniref:S41 family peptidase n=1 Tax=Pelagibius sp. Alg239-R121 TaxID=2993448 RepID=UPI0024A62A17|nr:S41 family peptidase [Pelagibius sp. Alg239-R121]